MNKLRDQVATIWRGMPRWQQAGIGIVGVFAVIFMLAVGWNASRQDYAVLFAQLAPEDANAIVNKLKSKSVGYKLSDDGTAVFVSSEQVAPLRIELLAEDLPSKGGRGFELFDHTNLSATPFTNHINYIRALQNELAKTIMQIEPIIQARVHIVKPEASPFLRSDLKPASASIVVKLRAGAALTRKTGAGIVALVARSVEGLTRENVTIIDTSGRQLSEGFNGEDSAAAHADAKVDLESTLAKKAEELLSRVLGPGKAVVRVTAELNLKTLKEHRIIYDPESRALKLEKTIERKESGTSNKGAGIPGINAPRGAAPTTGGGSSNDTTFEYVTSSKILDMEEKFGGILHLSVAGFVDLSASDGSDGKKPMTLSAAQDAIKRAIGVKEERDAFFVTEAKFQPPVPIDLTEDESAEIRKWNRIATIVRDVSIGFTAITVVVLAYSMVRRRRVAQDEAAKAAAASATPAISDNPDDVRMIERLADTFRTNPDALSRVLADWLDQGETRIKTT